MISLEEIMIFASFLRKIWDQKFFQISKDTKNYWCALSISEIAQSYLEFNNVCNL